MSITNFWLSVRNLLKALRSGDLLLHVRADKYYIHVMYVFLLMWISIMLSLQVDKTLTKAGANKAAIEELRIHHTESEAALVKVKGASPTETRLKKMGSAVQMPTEPATVVKRK